ncbi:MAG: CRISPR-associated CARF protein Csa3 [Halobacteria archaeon]
MTTYLSNLGFDITQIHRFINNQDLSEGDKFVIIQTDSDDRRSDQAVDDLRQLLRNILDDFTLKRIIVEPLEFEETTIEIKTILEDVEDDLVVNLGGGDRAVLTSIVTTCITAPVKLDEVSLHSDTNYKRKEIDLPNVSPSLNETEKRVLTLLVDEKSLIGSEISSELDISRGTVSQIIHKLSENGFVEIERDGKNKSVTPTLSGQLISTM